MLALDSLKRTADDSRRAYNRGAMEMKPEQLRNLVISLFDRLRELETEILVYNFAAFIMEQQGVISVSDWGQIIVAARENPALKTLMDEKYGPIISGLLQSIETAEIQSKAEELLLKWQPTKKPN
jgi:hypothetical protein